MFRVLVKSWSNNYSNKFDVCNRIIESSGSLVQLFDFLDAHWSTNDTTNMVVDRPSLVMYDCTSSTIVFYYETCVRLHVSVQTNLDHSVESSVQMQALHWPFCMFDKLHGPGTTYSQYRIDHKELVVFDQQPQQFLYFCTLLDLKGPLLLHSSTSFLPWDKMQRLGEAKNPGPELDHNVDKQIRFSLVNPTGLFKKDDLIAALGPGTYSIAETHATVKAQRNMQKAFRARLINPIFGPPVPPHLGNDTCKGVASGVACLSTFPCRLAPMDGFDDLFNTCRIMATHVNIGPNLTCLVVTIYAPPRTSSHFEDPKGFTIQLLECAASVVQNWRGPAIIAGDFNQDILQFDVVRKLFSCGWDDGQTLNNRRYGSPIQPTCVLPQGVSYFSNILCNPVLIRSFNWCTTTDESFCGHPVLTLSCNLAALRQKIVIWKLPKPLECHKFDEDALNQCQQTFLLKTTQIDKYLDQGEIEAATRIWTQITERTLAVAARDSNGIPENFTPAHFQRHKGPKFQSIPVSQPIVKWGRSGDHQTCNMQGPVWHRQHLRQLRRLQTLVNLVKAMERDPNDNNVAACSSLWVKIVNAPGFSKGFPIWVVNNLHTTWPMVLPNSCAIEKIYLLFLDYFREADRLLTKETRKQTKKVFDDDWNKGGSLSFKAIKEEGVQPLCFVARTVSIMAKKTRWTKKGITNIKVDTTHNLQVDLPIVFQGQKRKIVSFTSNSIIVDKPVSLRDRNFVIKQTQYIYQPHEAGNEVVNSWNAYLQRDNADDNWEKAEDILPCIPAGPTIDLPDFDPILWQRVQAKTPLRSARGSCGFTVRELKNIPIWLLMVLFNIFRCVEHHGTWPQVWVMAFTVLLPKSDNPSNALELRPITILSRVYRLWSRYRAISLISGLTKLVPNTVAGGTCNMSSLLLSGHFQDLLEDDDNLRTLCGLTVDIVKCYNTIPRYPLALFMLKLGWPLHIVKTYMAALYQMRRTFLVLNSASAWQKATTGIPEGCALAVASMLTLSIVVYHFVKTHSPTADAITFADNWSFIFENFQQATAVIGRLEEFCAALRLRLSIPKSWTWALNSEVAQQLATVHMQGEPIPNHQNVKDLGVDLTYRGRKTKQTLFHRIALGLKRCKAVAKVGGSKLRKPRLVQGSCFPKSSYGCALLHPPKNKFTSFRTETAKALGFSRTGASPWIALNLLPKNCDFEYHVVLSTITFWRQYFRIFPERKSPFLKKVCDTKFNGPSGTLRTVLKKLGELNDDAHLLTEQFGRVDWMTCSKKFLKFVVNQQWNRYVCNHLHHRKHFTAESTDSLALRKYCSTLNAPDFYGLSVHLTGAHYTQDLKSKFLDEDHFCPLCQGSIDSRAHRTLECPALEHLRCKWTCNTWKVASETVTAHLCLLEMPCELSQLRLVIPTLREFFPSVPTSMTDYTEITIFVDGACFYPTYPLTSLAAGAAIVVEPNPSRSVIHVHRMLMPTRDHNSHRAEIYALLLGLRLGNALHIYSDCQSVIDAFHLLSHAVYTDSKIPDLDNWDLWVHVLELLQNTTKTIHLYKTKGHDSSDGKTIKHWQAWANNEVDKHAKAAILDDNSKLYDRFTKAFHVLQSRHAAHQQILHFHVEAAKLNFQSRVVANIPNKVNGERPDDTVFHVIPSIPEDFLSNCPINVTFLHRLVVWGGNLEWESQQTGETSFLEITLDYIFTTGTYPPLPVPKFDRKGQSNKKWILLDQHVGPYELSAFTFEQAIQGLSRTVNWIYKKCGILIFPHPTKHQTVPLKRFGFRGHPAGIPRRAKLNTPLLVDEWCHKNLCGQTNFRLPLPSLPGSDSSQ